MDDTHLDVIMLEGIGEIAVVIVCLCAAAYLFLEIQAWWRNRS